MATTAKDLIPFCRYFKGEKQPPKGVNERFWEYEQAWVRMSENPKEGSANFNILSNYLDYYLRSGFGTFDNDDNVPITLKALLLDRYTHFNECTEGFTDWYRRTYKNKKGQ